jgi:hypothetical protein
MILYNYALERKIRDMNFSAVLHGADPKELGVKDSAPKEKDLVFGDPKDYANMTDEEKAELTKKMKKKFFRWAKVKEDG